MFFFFLILPEIVILIFIDDFAIGMIYKFEPIQTTINEPLFYMQQGNNIFQIAFIKHQEIIVWKWNKDENSQFLFIIINQWFYFCRFSVCRYMLFRPCTFLNEGFSNLMLFKPFQTWSIVRIYIWNIFSAGAQLILFYYIRKLICWGSLPLVLAPPQGEDKM